MSPLNWRRHSGIIVSPYDTLLWPLRCHIRHFGLYAWPPEVTKTANMATKRSQQSIVRRNNNAAAPTSVQRGHFYGATSELQKHSLCGGTIEMSLLNGRPRGGIIVSPCDTLLYNSGISNVSSCSSLCYAVFKPWTLKFCHGTSIADRRCCWDSPPTADASLSHWASIFVYNKMDITQRIPMSICNLWCWPGMYALCKPLLLSELRAIYANLKIYRPTYEENI